MLSENNLNVKISIEIFNLCSSLVVFYAISHFANYVIIKNTLEPLHYAVYSEVYANDVGVNLDIHVHFCLNLKAFWFIDLRFIIGVHNVDCVVD